jgi:hypothetical protein
MVSRSGEGGAKTLRIATKGVDWMGWIGAPTKGSTPIAAPLSRQLRQ